MQHGIYRVQSFDIISAYTLRVRFNDETEQVINFEPVLVGELFGPLRDLKLFNQVRIDPEVHTLVWPNGSDFEPATLHDWPDIVDDPHSQGEAMGSSPGLMSRTSPLFPPLTRCFIHGTLAALL
jgi:Protein of unknown function (DUF2442)